MGRISFRLIAAAAAACICIVAMIGTAAAQSCDPKDVKVVRVEKLEAQTPEKPKPAPGAADQAQTLRPIRLGDTVAITIDNLAQLTTAPCRLQDIALFLNKRQVRLLPIQLDEKKIGYELNTTDSTSDRADNIRADWNAILSSKRSTIIDVSIGIVDRYAFANANNNETRLELKLASGTWLWLWLVVYAVMIGGFWWCARNTNIIRDGSPLAVRSAGAAGTFSLAKTQGAVWFFAITAAYIWIGIVTGDFSNSINDTALILLGIGAGTVLGSAVIDASKSTEESQTKEAAQVEELGRFLADYEPNLAKLTAAVTTAETAVPPDPEAIAKARQERLSLIEQREQKASLYRKLTRQSENFLTDILSDANGVSFHRFQMAVWTLVLAIIFVKDVIENLAMPVFNMTLMGLLGLSAGTYLGLKIPEATTAKPTEVKK